MAAAGWPEERQPQPQASPALVPGIQRLHGVGNGPVARQGRAVGRLEAGSAVTFLGQRFTVQGPGPWSWWGRALEELKWGPGPWSELGDPSAVGAQAGLVVPLGS